MNIEALKKSEGYIHLLDSLEEFIIDTENGLTYVRKEFPKVIEKAKKHASDEETSTELPYVDFDGNVLSISMSGNMAAFCGNPTQYENVICYYAIRAFFLDNFWDDEDTLDDACDTWLWELVEYRSKKWKSRILRFLRIKKESSDIAIRYYARFNAGKTIVAAYESLLS